MRFIELTRTNGKTVYVNIAQIKAIEATEQGTLIAFTGDMVIDDGLVQESPYDIMIKIRG